MATYKKKSEFVEAEQFIPYAKPLPFHPSPVVCLDERGWYIITIREERIIIVSGDWIILDPGKENRAYVCKDHIFRDTYELVKENTHEQKP